MAKKSAPAEPVVRAPGQDAAPSTALATAADLSMPAHLKSYLKEMQLQDADGPVNPEQAWLQVAKGLQMETAGRILAGFNLKRLRDSLPDGQFAAGLGERNIPRSTSYDAISTFDFFDSLPDEAAVRALGQLGITKVRALGFQTPEECTDFAKGQEVRGLTYEQAVEKSSREISAHRKEWQAEHDDEIGKLRNRAGEAETKLQTANNELDRIRRLNQKIQVEADLPHFALAVRQEAMVLTEQMSFALDTLQAMALEHLLVDIDHPDAERYQPVAAGTLYYALGGILARIHAQMGNLAQRYPDHINDGLHLKHQLTPIEFKMFLETRERLLGAHQADESAREIDRENSRPGRRGRKRSK